MDVLSPVFSGPDGLLASVLIAGGFPMTRLEEVMISVAVLVVAHGAADAPG
jgi:hypothetical protein